MEQFVQIGMPEAELAGGDLISCLLEGEIVAELRQSHRKFFDAFILESKVVERNCGRLSGSAVQLAVGIELLERDVVIHLEALNPGAEGGEPELTAHILADGTIRTGKLPVRMYGKRGSGITEIGEKAEADDLLYAFGIGALAFSNTADFLHLTFSNGHSSLLCVCHSRLGWTCGGAKLLHLSLYNLMYKKSNPLTELRFRCIARACASGSSRGHGV